jgi:hypothetical protein
MCPSANDSLTQCREGSAQSTQSHYRIATAEGIDHIRQPIAVEIPHNCSIAYGASAGIYGNSRAEGAASCTRKNRTTGRIAVEDIGIPIEIEIRDGNGCTSTRSASDSSSSAKPIAC